MVRPKSIEEETCVMGPPVETVSGSHRTHCRITTCLTEPSVEEYDVTCLNKEPMSQSADHFCSQYTSTHAPAKHNSPYRLPSNKALKPEPHCFVSQSNVSGGKRAIEAWQVVVIILLCVALIVSIVMLINCWRKRSRSSQYEDLDKPGVM